jgi:lysozyme
MAIRRVSSDGIEKITQWEGQRLKSYRDSGGVWTVGVGHTSDSNLVVGPTTVITAEQSDELLRKDLDEVEQAIARIVKVPLNDNQFTVLASLAFNIGITNFAKSTLVKKLNASNYNAVPSELAKWVKDRDPKTKKMVTVPGLVNRRAAEAGLWVKGAHVASRDVVPVPVNVSNTRALATKENIATAASVATAGFGAAATNTAIGYALAFVIVVAGVYVIARIVKMKKAANT